MPGESATHEELWSVARKLPSDFEPYGERSREEDWGPDCSVGMGCRFFSPLLDHEADWGVCSNPASPRAGLLTFEHQGCKKYEPFPDEQKRFIEMKKEFEKGQGCESHPKMSEQA